LLIEVQRLLIFIIIIIIIKYIYIEQIMLVWEHNERQVRDQGLTLLAAARVNISPLFFWRPSSIFPRTHARPLNRGLQLLLLLAAAAALLWQRQGRWHVLISVDGRARLVWHEISMTDSRHGRPDSHSSSRVSTQPAGPAQSRTAVDHVYCRQSQSLCNSPQ